MRVYLAKRILYFIPTLLGIVLLSFILLHNAPGDPVERIMSMKGMESEFAGNSPNSSIETELRKNLGLDLPLFYFSLSSLAEKKTAERKTISSTDKYIPAVKFNSSNQFHRWLFGDPVYSKGLLYGDLGISWATQQPVSSMIAPRIKWSILFTLLSVVFAYLISIPAGLKSASKPESKFSSRLKIITVILFSLPAFWVATLLMFLFCNPSILNILPSSGIGPTGGFEPDKSFLYVFVNTLPYLILPLICYTYSSFAFLSGNIRDSVREILKEDYIRTARAKGLNEKTVLKKHALRNAWLPMITIFSQVLPMAIGGSVILETVFTIPGMGLAVYQSISSQDYPVIISVFMITGIITMFSFLLSDILYALADPRINFSSNENIK